MNERQKHNRNEQAKKGVQKASRDLQRRSRRITLLQTWARDGTDTHANSYHKNNAARKQIKAKANKQW